MYLIGLTGNIATGKSTVRSILEQLGAKVVDADLVAHTVLRRGSPSWRALVEQFGYDILQYDGTVDRRKLGALVFGDAAKLRTLERITHPAVGTELALIVRDWMALPDSDNLVGVIEAVKLYEAGLTDYLDALWVVTAPPQEQLRRLVQDRGMSQADAAERLRAQPPLQAKLKRANVVIDNGGSIEQTRVQVLRAFAAIDPKQGKDKSELLCHWLGLIPPKQVSPVSPASAPPPSTTPPAASPAPSYEVRRARPGDARMLAELLARINGRAEPLTRAEMLEHMGKLGYWLARTDDRTAALAAWQAENLTVIVLELWAENQHAAEHALPPLLQAIEAEANALTCEVVVLALTPRAAQRAAAALAACGYAPTQLEQLHKLWRSVVEPHLSGEQLLYAKPLREIVTRPI